MSEITSTSWPPAEEASTRQWLLAFYGAAEHDIQAGKLAVRGIENRASAPVLMLQAAVMAAQWYDFLRCVEMPGLHLPELPSQLAVTVGLLATEVRELANHHDEVGRLAEERGDGAEAERRRARAMQLWAMVGEVAP